MLRKLSLQRRKQRFTLGSPRCRENGEQGVGGRKGGSERNE